MFFTYVDETGIDGRAPAVVMAGIVVNAERLNRTQVELEGIFDVLGDTVAGKLKELKSSDFLVGKGGWKNVDNEVRCNIITHLCEWLSDRKHRLVLAAICFESFNETPPDAVALEDIWQAAAWHIALQLQRSHQSERGNKGRTVLVFDDNKRGIAHLSEGIYSPPDWTDSYYERGKKQGQMDQLIDTPFAVQSHHVGLVQIADLFAGIFRRYIELHDYDDLEKYLGERERIGAWVEILAPQLIGRAHRWPKRSKSSCAQWYVKIAPASLLALK